MNASYATVILCEMIHRWAKVQDLPGSEVAGSSEKKIFDRMAAEFPAMAMVAKLMQATAFDYVNAMAGYDALPGDLQANADTLARLICRSAPDVVRAGMAQESGPVVGARATVGGQPVVMTEDGWRRV